MSSNSALNSDASGRSRPFSGQSTFNGLPVTVIKPLNEKRAHRVMILDADQHMGDGTDDILTHLSLYDRVEHMPFGMTIPALLLAQPGVLRYVNRAGLGQGMTRRRGAAVDFKKKQGGLQLCSSEPSSC